MWNQVIAWITKVNGAINSVVWGWPMIILILGAGLYLSVRTRFLQVRKFGESWGTTLIPTIKDLFKGKKAKGDGKSVSQFEAFSAAISGTVGTGNIIGVTYAILAGGPGAVFWMWVSAFFGMVTNYSENVLGLYYRKKDKDGNFAGGAFYYIANGLGWKWLGYVAAVFAMLAAVGMSGAQTNKISATLAGAFGNTGTVMKLCIGIAVAALTAVIIIGGIKRIGKVASKLVPIMSLLFMVLSLGSIFAHIGNLPEAFKMIFSTAFNFKAAGSGIMGYAFATVIRQGMARGVFSNEAGLGSSVIAHSASETREPVKQGLWGVFEVFFDTFIICTLTALMLLTSGITLTPDMEDAAVASSMFTDMYGTFGGIAFAVILPLFAFTTILAWSYYGEKATEFCFQFLGDKKKIAVTVFKVLYVLLIVGSAVINGKLIWDIDDTCNGLMALPNLIALIALGGVVAKVTKNYFDRKKGVDVKPMLSAYEDLNEEFIKDIQDKDAE